MAYISVQNYKELTRLNNERIIERVNQVSEDAFNISRVNELPNKPNGNTIYLVEKENSNSFSVYVYAGAYIKIGETDIDISAYATKKELNDAIDAVIGFNYSIVNELPSEGKKGIIYLVPIEGDVSDAFSEHLWVDNKYEKIGTTKVDIDGYATLEDVDNAIATHKSEADEAYASKFNIPTKLSDLENDCEFVVKGDIAYDVATKDKDGLMSAKDKENLDKIVAGGGSGSSVSAENVAYSNDAYPDYSNVNDVLAGLLDKVNYVKPTCKLSADKAGGTYENGTVLKAPITFTWTVNKEIKTQTLTDCELANSKVRTYQYDKDISSNKSFTLTVSDGQNKATSAISYKFADNVFWGSAGSIDEYNTAFINALANKALKTDLKGSYEMTVADGEYGYIAVPSNFNIASVWIGGFEVTLESLGTVSYTNQKNYTRDYKLYRTVQKSLGKIVAEIK